ncbi:MAG: nucleotide pyrophosphohydrolase [Deltaproteobacteria bacterium]|nr:nucleotide pyrophosphohydrolase [Deltaproteobacteria bacterium]
MPSSAHNQKELTRLLDIVTRLRGDDGCPWDRRQTPASIKKYLLEETRELAEAIDGSDPEHIREEIGDLFFILTMLTTMYEEQGHFGIDETLAGIAEKMVRRHPHVFAGMKTGTEQELRRQWEEIKAGEKANQTSI